MTLEMQDRTELVAHYIIRRSRPDELGSIKLNKVMWFADLEAYRRLGKTITGQQSYQKRQFGPVPNGIVSVLLHLGAEGKIIKRPTPAGAHMRHEYIWMTSPDVSSFEPEEIDILNEAIGFVCNEHTAMSISDLTHNALWEAAQLGEQIPIGAASIELDDLGADDISWALAELELAD